MNGGRILLQRNSRMIGKHWDPVESSRKRAGPLNWSLPELFRTTISRRTPSQPPQIGLLSTCVVARNPGGKDGSVIFDHTCLYADVCSGERLLSRICEMIVRARRVGRVTNHSSNDKNITITSKSGLGGCHGKRTPSCSQAFKVLERSSLFLKVRPM